MEKTNPVVTEKNEFEDGNKEKKLALLGVSDYQKYEPNLGITVSESTQLQMGKAQKTKPVVDDKLEFQFQDIKYLIAHFGTSNYQDFHAINNKIFFIVSSSTGLKFRM